ncbi:hypothetical protein Ahy_A10g049916 [Arachis hypogaea]|uniref:CCHC-type domain-containing protein n=1 Tax=Arachis hypogaea TaxID=3818 RepID=A0A445B874_ARAHY|nr:hypothetical protein Ahy_A10g049916 [Arachis hypogaea]
MRKIATHKKKLENHSGHLAPVQQKKLDKFVKPKANKWRARLETMIECCLTFIEELARLELTFNKGPAVVMFGNLLVKLIINPSLFELLLCLLLGMPCCHAVAAMYKIGLKPEEYVHQWLTMQSIKETYMHCIKPVNSEEYWTPCDALRTELPNIKGPAHRPKMKRKVDLVETGMHATKAKKTFEVTCSKCGQLGHYYKTCKNDPKDPNWQPLTKKERRVAKGKGLQIVQFDPNQNRGQDRGPSINLSNDIVPPAPPMDPLRRKHPIVRPSTASISVLPSFGLHTPPPIQVASGLRPCVPTGQTVHSRTTTANVPLQQSAISAETMAAVSSGTTARLFKFIPIPGFIPSRKT